MKKRVVDLTPMQLDEFAAKAWADAAETALRRGATVVGRDGSKISKTYPDGKMECLGDASPLEAVQPSPSNKSSRERVGRGRRIA
jgi:hypothetical protein